MYVRLLSLFLVVVSSMPLLAADSACELTTASSVDVSVGDDTGAPFFRDVLRIERWQSRIMLIELVEGANPNPVIDAVFDLGGQVALYDEAVLVGWMDPPQLAALRQRPDVRAVRRSPQQRRSVPLPVQGSPKRPFMTNHLIDFFNAVLDGSLATEMRGTAGPLHIVGGMHGITLSTPKARSGW